MGTREIDSVQELVSVNWIGGMIKKMLALFAEVGQESPNGPCGRPEEDAGAGRKGEP
jgi:hypothetical protein